jgi:glycosyltransferase involved in cell wall biosynthesis
MRLSYIVDEPLPSNDTLTVQVVSTLVGLRRAGVEVELFVPVPPWRVPRPEQLAAAVERHYQLPCDFPVRPVPALLTARRVPVKLAQPLLAAPQLLHRRFDLVYTRNVLPLVAALAAGKPVVFETYRPLTQQFPWSRHPLRAAAQRRAFLGLVTHSEYARQAFLADGLPPDRVTTIHNGFDAAHFAEHVAAPTARAQLGLPQRPTLVYAGRIAPLKRIELLLDAAEALPELQLVLVGEAGSAEARAYVERGRSLPNVSFPGYRTGRELALALLAGDALIIPPSRAPLEQHGRTVLPIKVFQYLAAGRPIVTGEVPDTAELLRQDETAVRVAPDDVAALVAALRALLADAPRRERLGAAARALSADLTWDARGRRLAAWMRERLARARGG